MRKLILAIGFLLILFLFGIIEMVKASVKVGGYIPECYLIDDNVELVIIYDLLT